MSAAQEPWSQGAGWRDFLDLLADAVVVLDAPGRVVLANTAALRLLPVEAGFTLDQLEASLGAAAVQWLKQARRGAAAPAELPPAPMARLADGRVVELGWQALDGGHSALRLTLAPAGEGQDADATTVSLAQPVLLGAESLRDTLQFFWESPFPAMVQDEKFRVLDVNTAFVRFTGYEREALVGRDPQFFYPAQEWPSVSARRERLRATNGRTREPALVAGRIIDAHGRDLQFRVARRVLRDAEGRTYYLAVMQDATAEHVATERAHRSLQELDDWFGLSPVGMVLFDDAGLLLRTNAAFDALVGSVPASLAEAPAGLRQLLAWDGDTPLDELQAGTASLRREGAVAAPGGQMRALRSTVRPYITGGGQRRYMAVIEDRSVEEERDLAQMQIGALMDTAGVGLATFEQSSGWLNLGLPAAGQGASGRAGAALQSISRDMVEEASLPEFEKIQQALRTTQRAEARYEIHHAELGRRWLLTRVEPARLASGKVTSSVVTLDITDQHSAQERSDQLLHELSSILESTSAGIAYLRGDRLMRCNRRFEAMLGLTAGATVGMRVQDLFGSHPQTERIAADAYQALIEGALYETEIEVEVAAEPKADATPPPGAAGPARWYSLSVRRMSASEGAMEAIAVLSDVTRLKLQQRELEALARDRELMFSLSGVGIAFVQQGRIQRANQALAHLAGYTVAELSTLPLSMLFPEGEFETRWQHEQQALRAHGRWTGERQMRMRDGRHLWVQVSKQLVTMGDPSGGIIASYVNVDSRHRAERAVAMQADRTRSILDSVLVGIVTVGPQGIEWMNRSARRMFGGDLDDFVNLPIATVATPEPGHPFHRTEYLTELVEGQAEMFECRVKARDGREFWVVGNVVSTARESTGRQLTYALLDIDRRRQAEARMSQAQASLQRIIEAAPLAITLRDAHTLKVLELNEVAAGIGGMARADLLGRTPEQIFGPAVAAERRRDMRNALLGTEVSKHEYRVEIDGEMRVWDARYLPLASVPGEPPDQLLLVATDVTEQRAAEAARFDAAIAQRDMLVKEVHHRIKNNLQGVAGLLEQIAQRKPEVAGAISEVVGQVHAIAQVYGLQVGESGALHVVSVVKAITASVQRTFGRAIRFEVRGATAHQWLLPEAESIPIALTINELLTNAVKHSTPDAPQELNCTMECEDAGVLVRISNAGALPPGFNLARIPGGMSGLGLVRALLPRRSASLQVEQRDDRVHTTMALRPPGVVRSEAAGLPGHAA